MSRKWMLVAGVGALVVIVIAAAVLLATNKTPSSSGKGTTTAGLGGSGSSADSSSTNGTGGSGGSSSGGSGTGTGTQAGGSGSGAGTSKGGSNGTTPKTVSSLPPLKPFKPMPDPTLPAVAAKAPAAKGAVLPPLTAAPDPTISGLDLGKVPDGSIYRITLRPYGYGPASTFGTRIAVRVDASTPLGSAPKLAAIVNANLLVVIDTSKGGAITSGGTYDGNLTFRSDGTKLLPILSGVSVKK